MFNVMCSLVRQVQLHHEILRMSIFEAKHVKCHVIYSGGMIEEKMIRSDI